MTFKSYRSKGLRGDARKCLGFSIVEVVVAVVLAAIMFAAVFTSGSEAFNILNVTRQNLRATQIMVSRLEGLRLEAWSSSTNELAELFNTAYVPTTFSENFYPSGLNNTTNGGITYYGTMSVVQLTSPATQASIWGGTIPSYATNMALVTITLTWTNSANGNAADGTARTRSMSTLVSAYGLQNYIYAQ